MADEKDILGISGQLDISDIVGSIDRLYSEFGKVGNISKETAAEVERAFKAVGNATKAEVGEKAKQALDVFKRAFEEAKSGAEQNVSKIESTIERLQAKLAKLSVERSDTVIGTKTYDNLTRQMESLNTQIHNQQNLLAVARGNAISVGDAYNAFLSQIATANSAVDAFNAVSSGSTVAVGANTVAHTAAGVAVGVEAMQHGKNTESINEENQAMKESAQLSVEAAQADEGYVRTKEEAIARITELIEKFHQLRDAQAEYTEIERARTNAITTIDAYSGFGISRDDFDLSMRPQTGNEQQKKAVEQVTEAIREQKDAQNEAAEAEKSKVQQLTEELAKAQAEYKRMIGLSEDAGRIRTGLRTRNVVNAYQEGLVTEAEMQRIIAAAERVEQLKQALKEARAEAANSPSVNSESATSPQTDWAKHNSDIQQYKQHITDLQAELDKLLAEQDKISNKENLTGKQQQDLDALNGKIEETKRQLQEAEKELKRLNGETTVGNIRNFSLTEKIEEAKRKLREFIDEHPNIKKIEDAFDRVKNKVSGVGDALGNNNGVQRFKAEYEQITGLLGDYGTKIGNVLTGNGRFQQSLGQVGSAFGALGAPIKAATSGVLSMTKALWSMAMTPVGAVIAAIVVALQALHSWLNKSAEGQRAMAKISAFLGSIMASLSDIMIKLGGYIFHAFADAGAPMNAFARGMVTTIKGAVTTVADLLSGLGNTIKGIFTMDWDTFSKGMGQIWDGIKGAGSTAINVLDTALKGISGTFSMIKDGYKTLDSADLKAGIGNIVRTATEAARLADQQLDAQVALGKAKEYEAKVSADIAREREKIYMLSGKEKDAQIEKVKAMEKEKYDRQIAAQQQLYEIQRKRNQLHTVSLEDIKAERNLHIEVLQTQAQQVASTRMLVRMQQSNLKSMANANKKDANTQAKILEAEAKLEEVIRKNGIARVKAAVSIEDQITDATIAAMEEGAEKVHRLKERELQKRIDDIERSRKEAIEAERNRQKAEYDAQEAVIKARGGQVKAWSDEMLDQQEIDKINDYFKRLLESERMRQIQDQRNIEDDLIQSHQSYVDRKLAIDKKYRDDVAVIDAAIADAEARGDTERVEALRRSRIEAARQRAESQASLSLDELKKTPEYVRAFEDLGNTSSETLNFLIGEFERAKEAAAQSLDPEHLREYTNTLQQMYDELNARNPFKSFAESAKELKKAQDEVREAQERLNLVKGGTMLIKSITYDKKTKKFNVENWDEEKATRALAAAKDKEAQAYNRVLKAVGACSQQIMQFGSMLEQLGNSIGGSFGGALGAVGGIANSLGGVIGSIQNINTSATGLSAVLQKVNAIGTTVSAMIDLNMKLNSILPDSHSLYEHYAAKQREINEMQQRIMELQIDQLEDRLNKEHWIYSNGLTNLKKGAELNKKYLAAYGKVATQPQEIYQNAGSGFSSWAPAIFGAIVGIIGGVLTFGAGSGIGAALGATIGSAIGGTAIGAALGSTVIAAIGTAIFAGAGAAFANAVRAGIDTLTYDSGQTAAINNMRVQTRHRTFFRSEKTQDLQSWVKENWGEDLFEDVKGVSLVDPEVARKILGEGGPTLVGETRETLEKLLEYSEKAHEFLDEIHEYVSNAFSPLVDNLTDALWDWLKDGTDVMDSFRKYAGDTFQSIAKDAMKAIATQLIFEPFQEQLEDLTIAFSTGQMDETAYMLGVSAFATQAQEAIEKYLPSLESAMQTIQMAFDNAGIDIVGGTGGAEDKSATYNSLEKWTYDQADELINRATALQIIDEHQYEILSQSLDMAYSTMQGVESIRITVSDILDGIQTTIDLHETTNARLERIVQNTAPIAEIRDLVKKLYNER